MVSRLECRGRNILPWPKGTNKGIVKYEDPNSAFDKQQKDCSTFYFCLFISVGKKSQHTSHSISYDELVLCSDV